MARKFLYIVLFGTLLVMAGLFALRQWAGTLSEIAFVPSTPFEAPAPLSADAYAATGRWVARPGQAGPTAWLPRGATAGAKLDARVFYVHPTSLFDRTRWNAALSDPAVDAVTDAFVRAQASAFNAGEVWAPRYRQATFGAMLTAKPEGRRALDVAYGDVRAAFAAFLRADRGEGPIVLVGHSQGALLLMRLLRDEVAGKPVAARVAAAYVVGWPVSIAHDLPAMGLPACTGPDQPGCVLSWMSYAEPADVSATLAVYAREPGLDGASRRGSPIFCVNPLTGAPGTAAPASANRGTLLPEAGPAGAALAAGIVPARCGPQGFLLIGPGPQMGAEVMPGNNYHVYDIPLFWANVRADVARRVAAWRAAGR
ncbi:MAG: DUF3089 domain-containing protein [Sphingomonadales bacterium]|nr:DUF3089 domain-containing protein [Sphingomonadales bacterium]